VCTREKEREREREREKRESSDPKSPEKTLSSYLSPQQLKRERERDHTHIEKT
jgi:hypothetical protein